jgi:hypothetical protein
LAIATVWLSMATATPLSAQPKPDAWELFSEPDPKDTPAASSPGGAVSADTRAQASARFRDGEAAFARHEYRAAAEAFEAAHALVPHPASLFNAARARAKAGPPAAAANLYHRFLVEAPADARGRAEAEAEVARLSEGLGKLTITAAGDVVVRVDDEVVYGGAHYVAPGEHGVHARFASGPASRTVVAHAGEPLAITLEAPAAPPAIAPSTTASGATAAGPASSSPGARDTTSVEESTDDRGWSPWVVLVGGGVSALLIGSGVWSVVDGQDANEAYDALPSEENRAQRARVNARSATLLGLGGTAAVLTVVAAIWLVDWDGDEEADVAVSPGGVWARGRF